MKNTQDLIKASTQSWWHHTSIVNGERCQWD